MDQILHVFIFTPHLPNLLFHFLQFEHFFYLLCHLDLLLLHPGLSLCVQSSLNQLYLLSQVAQWIKYLVHLLLDALHDPLHNVMQCFS